MVEWGVKKVGQTIIMDFLKSTILIKFEKGNMVFRDLSARPCCKHSVDILRLANEAFGAWSN